MGRRWGRGSCCNSSEPADKLFAVGWASPTGSAPGPGRLRWAVPTPHGPFSAPARPGLPLSAPVLARHSPSDVSYHSGSGRKLVTGGGLVPDGPGTVGVGRLDGWRKGLPVLASGTRAGNHGALRMKVGPGSVAVAVGLA